MATQKQKFPVKNFPIRGSSLSKVERVSLVRSASGGKFLAAASPDQKAAKVVAAKIPRGK